MLLTATTIPAILVIITSVELDSLSYYSLLTPEMEGEVEEVLDHHDLIITGLLSMLLVLLLQTIFLVALTLNIYLFSEKIFHLVTYRRIL